MVYFHLIWFSSVYFGPVGSTSVQFDPIQFIWSTSIHLGPVRSNWSIWSYRSNSIQLVHFVHSVQLVYLGPASPIQSMWSLQSNCSTSVQFSPLWSISVHLGPIQSNWSTSVPFSPIGLQSNLAYFCPFGPNQSSSVQFVQLVHFGSNRSTLANSVHLV